MRSMDFSSWQGAMTTIIGLAVITLLGVGIRLIIMQTIQQRRERMNRQINERLKTLIAAYRTLGGSFTGQLTVDPTHLRDLHERARAGEGAPATAEETFSSERSRRMRDAVEAALADILLLGTEEHCRLPCRPADPHGGPGDQPARLHPQCAGPGADAGRCADSAAGAHAHAGRRGAWQGRGGR
jgi:hypothetical protein